MGVADFINFFTSTYRLEVPITILLVTVLFEILVLILGLRPKNKMRTIVVISISNIISSFGAEFVLSLSNGVWFNSIHSNSFANATIRLVASIIIVMFSVNLFLKKDYEDIKKLNFFAIIGIVISAALSIVTEIIFRIL